MKTYKNLYEKIISFENLWEAAKKARKGKRFRESAMAFDVELEKNIIRLQNELKNGTYQCGRYREFYVQESKKRFICAAPYRDRVVHHALCNVIEPIFEKTFIDDSYACRKNKGTHKAVERFSSFLRNPENRYALKCDIMKYFQSIDHEILLGQISKKIACTQTLHLIRQIVESGNTITRQQETIDYVDGDDLLTPLERHKGIPIGNLTSQFFANVYLNPLDHFVKETLKCRYYIRYVDDFVIVHHNKLFLQQCRKHIESFLETLRLRIHKDKTQVIQSGQGIDFLGYRVFPTHRRVRKSNVKRYKRKLRKMQAGYASGKMNLKDIHQRIASWLGHVRWADSYRLRQITFKDVIFQRAV